MLGAIIGDVVGSPYLKRLSAFWKLKILKML